MQPTWPGTFVKGVANHLYIKAKISGRYDQEVTKSTADLPSAHRTVGIKDLDPINSVDSGIPLSVIGS